MIEPSELREWARNRRRCQLDATLLEEAADEIERLRRRLELHEEHAQAQAKLQEAVRTAASRFPGPRLSNDLSLEARAVDPTHTFYMLFWGDTLLGSWTDRPGRHLGALRGILG